jgi:hypothetical protein
MTDTTKDEIDEMSVEKYLENREKALANGDDSFVTLDEFEENLLHELK